MLERLLILLSYTVILTGIEGLLHAGPISVHAVNFVSQSGLGHGREAPASKSTATSYAHQRVINHIVKTLIPPANFRETDVSIPPAQKEPANKSISPSAILVLNHFNSNFTTNSILTGSPSRSEQHTNLASQYPHLNENNMFQELPPIADAGPAQVVNSGSTVVLNGSNSKAQNGKIVSYAWEQVPTNAKITLSGVNSPVWEFIAPPVAGDTILRFQLTVTDNTGQRGHDTVNILDKPNHANVSQINPGMETIPAAKNSSLVAGKDTNSVLMPLNTKSDSQSLATAASTLSPPLTPPVISTGHR